MFLTIYLLSVTLCLSIFAIMVYIYPISKPEITPENISLMTASLIISFIPFLNTLVLFVAVPFTFSVLNEEGMFDKLKNWWHSPIFKDKE